MNDNPDISRRYVTIRVVLAIAVTAAIGLVGYLAIRWLAHLRP